MEKLAEDHVTKAVDSIQQRLTEYGCALTYESLPTEVVHGAKLRIIDTLGALIGGFFGEPCRIARDLAARMPNVNGATVLGTRMKTTPDMAAFVNGTTAHFPEMTDFYHWVGTAIGHPSDMVAGLMATGEHEQATGRELITATVLAYEVFLRISDACPDPNFDNTNFTCIAGATAAGKLLKLSPEQLAHCISMAVVRCGRTAAASRWRRRTAA